MAARPMDPEYEQRLRDEVIYLHSLWHQGPPRAAASASAPAVRQHLQPLKATQFKKEKKHRGKRGKKSTNKPNTAPESNSSPGAEWACPTPPPPPSTDGWPSLEAKPDSKPLSLSPKDSRNWLQNMHISMLSSFSSDEDDELMEEDDGRQEYSFFFKVFKEDAELREYYEKNFAKGEFSCLVCGAVGGKKTGKKFKGCLALVQHSITISKTKKRRAHRAFGQAVCKILGWDINQLPSIFSLLSDNSGEIHGNASSDQKESSISLVKNVASVEGKNEEAVPESGSIGTGILPNGDEGDMNSLTCPDDAGKNLEDLVMVHPHNVAEPAAEDLTSNSLTCPDADKSLENLGMVYPHNIEEPASEGLTTNSLTSPDADKNLENLGMVYPRNVEESASEGLIINSLMCSDADKNLENLDMVHPHNMEEPAAEGLTSVPLNENNGVGNEMQDPQMGNAVFNGLNEDNEIEN
ncbi:hypothetical protein Pfo_014033 [Paulownia fortunei]|nr:hypothetical protein Pfo_014033 [Paulownia fortunei]